jgi:SPP1 family predicted phage head-tail adaptor
MMTYEVRVLKRVAGAEDRYGVETVSWTTGSTINAWVQQDPRGREYLQGRETIMADWLILLPVDTDVDAYDRISYDGMTLEVISKPPPAPTPRGDNHLELHARLLEG